MGHRGTHKASGTLVTTALLVLLLTGCGSAPTENPTSAPGGTSPSETPTAPDASATPTPAATPADAATEPSSRLGLDCAVLVPEDLAAETVIAGLVALPAAALAFGMNPLSFAVEQLGGTACAATAPTAVEPVDGVGPIVPGYTVLVLPDATEQYARYAELYPGVTSGAESVFGDSSSGACFGRGAESMCTNSILVGSTWIEVTLRGIDVDAAQSDDAVAARVAPLLESIVATVAAAPAPAPLWTAPADAVALPEECAVYASADEARSAFERTEELWVGPSGGGGWSLAAGAWVMSGAQRCSWLLDNSDVAVLGVEALPVGAWAYDTMTGLVAASDQTESTDETIPGVERASFGCVGSTVSCHLDTVIGGNWVRFSTDSSAADPDTLGDRLGRIAEAAAARLVG